MAQDNKDTQSLSDKPNIQQPNHPFKSTYARLFVEMGLKTLKPEENISECMQNPNLGDISAARLIAAGSPMVIAVKTSAKTLQSEFVKLKEGIIALSKTMDTSNLTTETQMVEEYVKETLQAHEKLYDEVASFNKDRISQLKDAMHNKSTPSQIKAKTMELDVKQERLQKQTQELEIKITSTKQKIVRLKGDSISLASSRSTPLPKELREPLKL